MCTTSAEIACYIVLEATDIVRAQAKKKKKGKPTDTLRTWEKGGSRIELYDR